VVQLVEAAVEVARLTVLVLALVAVQAVGVVLNLPISVAFKLRRLYDV
jgi:hypothetical protein